MANENLFLYQGKDMRGLGDLKRLKKTLISEEKSQNFASNLEESIS